METCGQGRSRRSRHDIWGNFLDADVETAKLWDGIWEWDLEMGYNGVMGRGMGMGYWGKCGQTHARKRGNLESGFK